MKQSKVHVPLEIPPMKQSKVHVPLEIPCMNELIDKVKGFISSNDIIIYCHWIAQPLHHLMMKPFSHSSQQAHASVRVSENSLGISQRSPSFIVWHMTTKVQYHTTRTYCRSLLQIISENSQFQILLLALYFMKSSIQILWQCVRWYLGYVYVYCTSVKPTVQQCVWGEICTCVHLINLQSIR